MVVNNQRESLPEATVLAKCFSIGWARLRPIRGTEVFRFFNYRPNIEFTPARGTSAFGSAAQVKGAGRLLLVAREWQFAALPVVARLAVVALLAAPRETSPPAPDLQVRADPRRSEWLSPLAQHAAANKRCHANPPCPVEPPETKVHLVFHGTGDAMQLPD